MKLDLKLIESTHKLKSLIASNTQWGINASEKEFIYGMSLLTPQSYGCRIEAFIQSKLKFLKLHPKQNTGDLMNPKTKETYEVKASIITGSNNSLNLVQIRLWQNVDYYLCVAYDLRDFKIFKKYVFVLSHDEMKKECLNASSAHGTKTANLKNKNVELRLSIKLDKTDKRFNRWCKEYLRSDVF